MLVQSSKQFSSRLQAQPCSSRQQLLGSSLTLALCHSQQARLLEHVKKVAEAGNPQAVLDAIDKYAHSQE
jgi:hypothetical protein